MTPETRHTSPDTESEHLGDGLLRRAADLRNRFLVTLPFTVIVLGLSMVPALQFSGWQWVVAFASLPVVIWGAAPFHRAAFQAGRHGSSPRAATQRTRKSTLRAPARSSLSSLPVA